jgi:hypothetical protein
MRLVRLLVAGKSMVGLKDEESPYRVTQQRLLPKFGFEKRPPGSSRGRASLPETARVSAGSVPALAAAPRPRPSRSLAGKFAELFAWNKSKASPAVIAPVPLRHAIQGELRLDRVKVVRNDLSDADLEIVRLRPAAPSKAAAAVAAAAVKASPSSPAWGRVTLRLFGVGRT